MSGTLAIVTLGALAGGFVSGLAGFGTGLVALGIWLHAVPPALAATLVAACSVIAQVQTIRTVRHAIDLRHMWPMLAAGLLGVPLGTMLLPLVDPKAFRAGVGVLLIVFPAAMLLGGGARPALAWGGRGADALIGLGGGVLGGMAGLSGPLPTMWATLRGWGKDRRRGVFQAFNLTILGAAVLAHVAGGLVGMAELRALAWALPGTLTGAWLGARAYRRLSDRHFERVVLGLLALSGVGLLAQ